MVDLPSLMTLRTPCFMLSQTTEPTADVRLNKLNKLSLRNGNEAELHEKLRVQLRSCSISIGTDIAEFWICFE